MSKLRALVISTPEPDIVCGFLPLKITVLSIPAAFTWHNPFVMTHFTAIIAKQNVFPRWCGFWAITHKSLFYQSSNNCETLKWGKIYIRNFWIVSWIANIFVQHNFVFEAAYVSGAGPLWNEGLIRYLSSQIQYTITPNLKPAKCPRQSVYDCWIAHVGYIYNLAKESIIVWNMPPAENRIHFLGQILISTTSV